jgi:hypothetical protein
MVFLGASEPFPTRMVVVRLANGDLFLWSPTEPDEGLRKEIDALGAVRHLVSPNKLHYVHVCAWKRAYPEATAWASPGVKERAASGEALRRSASVGTSQTGPRRLGAGTWTN